MRTILSLMVAMVCFLSTVGAQTQDPKAREILDAMSKKYQEMGAFKAKFTYSLENANSGIKESSEGEIVVKGAKYHLKLKGQEVYNNGNTVWTYIEDANEVNKSTPEPDDQLNPTSIYNMYKKGYKYILFGEQVEGGKTYQIVDLEPINKNSQFYKVRIIINKKDKTVKSWKMFEKNGNRYVYTVKNFVPNFKVEDDFFSFDKAKYKGVQEVDLR